MHSFIALDLELTPASGDQPRIIEIAAVRFRGGAPVDTFESLVNPACQIDLRIKALTGIRQSQLRSAPSLGEVVPGFLRFIADSPIVGQSVNLDLESLEGNGVHLANDSFDTFELASVLLPGLPAYDLGSIGRTLGVEPEREHRALGDALVTGRVFLQLLAMMRDLSLDVLTQINALAAHVPDWAPARLFSDALRDRLRTHFQAADRPESPFRRRADAGDDRQSEEAELPFLTSQTRSGESGLHPSEAPGPVEIEELSDLMQAGGAVASSLEGFQERPEQLRMMGAIAQAFGQQHHLLVEAGTGTGKSLAYLLPAIYYSVKNGEHVVISTNTVNLQDQLYHKDLPALQGSLPVRFNAALVKGRANYVCLRRWQVMSRSPNLGREEAMLLIKTLVWLTTTSTGDRAELNLSASDAALWSRMSANAESCALGRCPQFRRGNCFVQRARKSAESAHVIVVNHALLLSDLATSGVLPEYSHVVIDEAHHLEEEATEQLGFDVGRTDLSSFLASIFQVSSGFRSSGYLSELSDIVRLARLSPEIAANLRAQIASATVAVETAIEETQQFFDALRCFLQDHAEDRRREGSRLRLTQSVRNQPGWSEIEIRWADLGSRLRTSERAISRVQKTMEDLEDDALPERDGLVADAEGFRSFLDRVDAQGLEIVSEPTHNGIYWIEGRMGDDLVLRSAPLHVGDALNAVLFTAKRSVVLTSATMTTEGCFDYVKERLGIETAAELMLGSPFDYRKSTLLYIAQDVPEPSKPSYQRAVEAAIADLVSALQGRTLVLFTSHGQLRLTNSAIRPRLEEQGIMVLAHGLDGSRRRLLQAFKGAERAVLFGTSSFWEGIDVVGEALSCVIIVKLPFAVPTDPIIAARSESFDEPFRQYSVPQTILKFKQGFGRLIRSASDRGIVAILDSRVKSKFYGASFIQSLPQCTVKVGSASGMVPAAVDWLRG